MSEQIAIISDVGIGSRDVGRPVLWFTVQISEHISSLQVFEWAKAFEILKTVYDVRELEGKPCWVETDGIAGTTRFIRMWKEGVSYSPGISGSSVTL